ncbi:unnamed protein product, partial [Polarella glacialis]
NQDQLRSVLRRLFLSEVPMVNATRSRSRSRERQAVKAQKRGPVAGARVVLNIPGPTEIPDEVLRAMHRQSLPLAPHGELDEIVTSIQDDLRPLFGCCAESEIFLHAANGHGMWDAILLNTLKPGDRILALESGMFSKDWADCGTACGLTSELMPGSWTAAVDLAKLEERLAADSERQIRAVLAVQVDTASGIKNDIEAIGAMMRRSGHDALFFVDAVACFAVHEMRSFAAPKKKEHMRNI